MKIKSLLSTLTILVTFMICIPFSVSADSVQKGDANGDGKINIRDAAFIAISLASNKKLDLSADYNNDGKADIRDAASIAIDAARNSGSYQNEILDLVNKERAKVGSAPLTINCTLNRMAAERAIESSDHFSHTRPNGEEFYTIFDEYDVDYSYCGENLAAGNSTAKDTVDQWINSPSHYQNMIDPEYTQIGIGYYYDENSPCKYHWVQLLMES